MWLLAIFVAVGSVGEMAAVEHVDIIEINHVQCERTDEIRLEQTILWRFRPWGLGTLGCVPDYYVVHWCMSGQASKPERLRGRWIVRTAKGRTFVGRICSETFTTFDPEVEDRKRLPTDLR